MKRYFVLAVVALGLVFTACDEKGKMMKYCGMPVLHGVS